MPLTVVATCGCTGRAEGRLSWGCIPPRRQSAKHGVAAVHASSVGSRRAGTRSRVQGASVESTAYVKMSIPLTHRRVELGQDPLAGEGQGGHVQLLRGLELQRAEGRESQSPGAQLGGRLYSRKRQPPQRAAATGICSCGEHACLMHCPLPPLSAPPSPAPTAHRPPQASSHPHSHAPRLPG